MLKNMSKQQAEGEEERKRIDYYMKLAEEDEEEVVPSINIT